MFSIGMNMAHTNVGTIPESSDPVIVDQWHGETHIRTLTLLPVPYRRPLKGGGSEGRTFHPCSQHFHNRHPQQRGSAPRSSCLAVDSVDYVVVIMLSDMDQIEGGDLEVGSCCRLLKIATRRYRILKIATCRYSTRRASETTLTWSPPELN
jgi:hypothetical protein